MKYEVWNYYTTKVIARYNNIISARKRVYKEQMAHKRQRFAIVREDGRSPGFSEFGEFPEYDFPIFQLHDMNTSESLGAYRLYPSGAIKRI